MEIKFIRENILLITLLLVNQPTIATNQGKVDDRATSQSDSDNAQHNGISNYEKNVIPEDVKQKLNSISTEAIEVEEEVIHDCEHVDDAVNKDSNEQKCDKHGNHDEDTCKHGKSVDGTPHEHGCCAHNNDGKTGHDKRPDSSTNTDKEGEMSTIDLEPKAIFLKNANEIAFKYKIDFAIPIFKLTGFEGSMVAGFTTPKTKELNYADVQVDNSYKLFAYAEFIIKGQNGKKMKIAGEVSIGCQKTDGQLKLEATAKLNVFDKVEKTYQKSYGNHNIEFLPFCVSIPQMAGIRFCQVAFDFDINLDLTGRVCLRTDIMHLVCPIPLVVVQYHCLNFSPKRLHFTKSTRKSSVIDPRQIMKNVPLKGLTSSGPKKNAPATTQSPSVKGQKQPSSPKVQNQLSSPKVQSQLSPPKGKS